MKERPILFSGEMVRAILDGRKTQTRRTDKYMAEYPPVSKPSVGLLSKSKHGEQLLTATWDATNGKFSASFCPYGQPGDQLWVKETGWERQERTPKQMREGADTWPKFAYDADGWSDQDHADFKEWGFKRRPSIHMPRWASRITLDITGVRVERLQEISEKDAIAEGVQWSDSIDGYHVDGAHIHCVDAVQSYRSLWESINGPGSWNANPWVWVIDFKVMRGAK